ncbi:hypothetical protein MKEN_00961000 [Mycena kentingensis (nom. inval.)]|nr:hypothetical protein MKEN_00961000 [Mycena kentingensis (nom. inval.)]
MSPNTNTIHHTAALVPPAWGHCVCYVHLVVQLLAADPTLVLTIIQHNSMVVMMQKEFASAEYDATRLKLVGVGSKEVKLTPMAMEMVFRELLGGWMDFLRGSESSDWPKPRTVHIDATCGGPIVDETKTLLGADAKLLLLAPFGGMSLKANCTDYDVAAACEEIYADEARRKGRSKEEIAMAIGAAFNGTDALTGQVVTHPGVPDMYDHERVSHAVGPRLAAYHILCGFQKVARRADGYIIGTSPALEPVGVPYLRKFYRERGQDVFAVGMQTHERKEKYGAKSARFISFGSLFFPVNQIPHVEALISVLLDISPPLPFIFALGGAMATKSLPEALIDRVNASGKGLVCQHWVEQRAILQHEAAGWFLTHGGYNSMTEGACR